MTTWRESTGFHRTAPKRDVANVGRTSNDVAHSCRDDTAQLSTWSMSSLSSERCSHLAVSGDDDVLVMLVIVVVPVVLVVLVVVVWSWKTDKSSAMPKYS
jgi:ABC-type uncharacterized transport system involved in gliding motility auxiliary subunit